jgi:hypothetical protein
MKSPLPYASLSAVLIRALDQAAHGKGMERHASPDEQFEDQPIIEIGRRLGSADFQLGQAVKKIYESKRRPTPRAVEELLGAIVYISAAIIQFEMED